MKKNLIIILLILFISTKSFSQNKVYTFCYQSVSLTIFDGGISEMIRYNSNGNIVNRVKGEWVRNTRGGGQPDLINMTFQGNEYKFDLIKDGRGIPSILYDNQMRTYTLCNSSKSSSETNPNTPKNVITKDDGFIIGTYNIPKENMKIVISKTSGELKVVAYKSGKILKFNTSCGLISNFVVGKVFPNDFGQVIHFYPEGCTEDEIPDRGRPNIIIVDASDLGLMSSLTKEKVLDISIHSGGKEIFSKRVKEIKY
jgi:hypothetical protein